MLTGRGEEIDRIVGLEVGADDYIAKPFSARELLARMKSVLRRSQTQRGTVSTDAFSEKRAKFAGWTLDLSVRKLFSPAGQEISLTPRQFDLLCTFVAHPRRILKREQILDLLGGNPDGSFDRSVDVQVMRLRRKIEKNPEEARNDLHGSNRWLSFFRGSRLGIGGRNCSPAGNPGNERIPSVVATGSRMAAHSSLSAKVCRNGYKAEKFETKLARLRHQRDTNFM